MTFPDSPRVLYDKNPLIEVICQLRFPTILRIGTEVPAAYQERVRQQYPLYRERSMLELPPNMPADIRQIIMASPQVRTATTAYDFISGDNIWTVTLARDFLALTCRQYQRWEYFLEHLKGPLQSLLELYSPAFFVRIGLRYQNFIRRTYLGLGDAAWSELLQSYVAGELASPVTASRVEESMDQILIRLDAHDGRVRVRHGLPVAEGLNEDGYLIDSDFYTERRTEVTDVLPVLNTFNRESRCLFRWCITDRLHSAMDPRPVDQGS